MRFHTFGDQRNKRMIMLSGSFCNVKSLEYLYRELQERFYIIIPEYNGHYPGTTFTTREKESEEIADYLKKNQVMTVDLLYGQSMGAEIGLEVMHRLLCAGIEVKKAFFDGAPCIKLSYLYKKLMNFKFKTMIHMLKDKSLEDVMDWKFLKKFTNGDTESLRPMLEPIMEIAPFISDETIRNENECCYTFHFPAIDDKKQKDICFFYAKEEKAYRLCYQGVKAAP